MIKKDKKKLRYSEKKRAYTPLNIILSLFVFSCLFIFGKCGTDSIEPEPDNSITGISIPSELYIEAEGTFTITGKGFTIDDQIILASLTDHSIKHTIALSSVSEQSATFVLPEGFISDSYSITLIHNGISQLLGSIFINVKSNLDIPDKEGMTIKGVVYCNGEGIEGVAVSDGYELTLTDNKGVYYLPSEKKNEYVFISVPGNYEVANDVNLPQFFQRLGGGSSVEQKDFSLIEADNSHHVVLTMADWHLANRNSDIEQFSNGFLQDVNTIIEEYESKGLKVYGLTLGDMTWDLYWYTKSFALPEYLVQMKKINCTIFNVMGNHDNDPYSLGDWLGADPYKEIVCPNYYSFNLGDVHYIVLDNIKHINIGGAQGTIGDRSYDCIINPEQLVWLTKDLATVKDPNTPIVLAMHAPLYKQPTVDENGDYNISYNLDNGTSIASLLNSYTNVHILTGHTHNNNTVIGSESIIEHNTAAVCATWWWTGSPGYAGNHICKDGSPGGYGIWEIDGNDLEWSYKSIGDKKDYQFRSYDLNTVQITAESFAPNSSDEALSTYVGDYASPNLSNEVLINIWGYDKDWTIKVTENGNELEVKQINAKDPLHIISYEAIKLNKGATPTSSFVTKTTYHFFKLKATSATSTLEIKVTDRFGNVYSETMTRPKALTYDMK